eukprot:CAMPEP_0181312354 /NCGR_PEP_ID=MMETSP1101-20121128/13650_1 /TAXON_ID=46948 /ORGANISM="Rhodomonas abbreviata, Strain Caron Lab Isolate" /LENGTH=37 /DNA_ID= /DNA_START= /DNA_END= /DNA_ORIENTATION=
MAWGAQCSFSERSLASYASMEQSSHAEAHRSALGRLP